MIAWLVKNWKIFLDIVVVVLAIILFTMFDPFGIFSKRSLKNTATILSGVKSIGELVTAEYYGEVISSLHGTRVYDLKPDTLNPEFENCFILIKSKIVDDVLFTLEDKGRLKGKQKRALTKQVGEVDYLKDIREEFKDNNIYKHLIVFLGVNNIRDSESFFIKEGEKDSFKHNAERRISEFILNEVFDILERLENNRKEISFSEFSDYIYSVPSYFSGVADFHFKLNKRKIKKPKHDIVFIGRGWVKAGFRFDQLNESNFYYDHKNEIIRFYGLSPEILDKDINPWFIPEKRIKGFELVDFYKKATFEEAKEVKIRCKQELLEQAQKAGIIEQALINGEESLQSFFALLTNTPDLQVQFHDIPFKKEINMIKADTLITVNEALLIDSIISQQVTEIGEAISPEREHKIEQLNIFVNQLNNLWFVNEGTPYSFFMNEAAKILNHKRFITPDDGAFICSIRDTLIRKDTLKQRILTTEFVDTLHYKSSYPTFVKQFNTMLDLLEREVSKVDVFREDSMTLMPDQLLALDLNPDYFTFDTVTSSNTSDSIAYFLVSHKNEQRNFKFTTYKYPEVTLPPKSLDSISIKNLSQVDTLLNSVINDIHYTTTDTIYNNIREKELDVIHQYLLEEIKHEIKVRPAKQFSEAIQELFGKK